VDRIFFEFDYSFSSTLSDALMSAVLATLFSGIRERALAFIANGTLPEAYLPLFMNDANYQQDYWGRLHPETLSYAGGSEKHMIRMGSFKIGRVDSNFEDMISLEYWIVSQLHSRSNHSNFSQPVTHSISNHFTSSERRLLPVPHPCRSGSPNLILQLKNTIQQCFRSRWT
jgi:hypothetical protein